MVEWGVAVDVAFFSRSGSVESSYLVMIFSQGKPIMKVRIYRVYVLVERELNLAMWRLVVVLVMVGVLGMVGKGFFCKKATYA